MSIIRFIFRISKNYFAFVMFFLIREAVNENTCIYPEQFHKIAFITFFAFKKFSIKKKNKNWTKRQKSNFMFFKLFILDITIYETTKFHINILPA